MPIPYGKQTITDADIQAVVAVLQSDFLTQGSQVPAFEHALAQYCGAQHAVAVCNATAALHIACLALGVGQGDVVWTTPTTFVASANCAVYCGARVDFVDIDPQTWNISPSALANKLAQAKAANQLPKVLIAVHLCGEPCDMQAIKTLADEYGVAIIEDASHAVGARYRGQAVGSGQYSDITVFSFHPVKIITTGEGGMCLTNRADLAHKLALLRSHGITRQASEMQGQSDGAWYYQQIDLGFNYRMTEMQAALGLSQLQRLDEFVARRQVLATQYDALLADLPIGLPYRDANSYSALHLYPIQVPAEYRTAIFNALREHEIGVNVHYIPVHTQPYYQQTFGFKQGDFPHAERYYAQAISLPMYFSLRDDEQRYVVDVLRQAINKAACT